MARRWRPDPKGRPAPMALLLLSVLAAVLSLGTVLRVYALEVEAKTTNPWYGYQSTVGFDYVGHVQPGKFYDRPFVQPDEMMRLKLPVEPPAYRRVLLSRFTDSVQVKIPYQFQGDRPGTIHAQLRVDGMLSLPGLWQKPYPLMASKEINVDGTEFKGVETFNIPVAQFLADMEVARKDYSITTEPLDLQIRPVLEVTVDGLVQPVHVVNQPEFLISIKSLAVEIDDVRQSHVDKVLAESKTVPITVTMFGYDVTVSKLRQISTIGLVISLIIALALVLMRRQKASDLTALQKLGPNLITVRKFELPTDTAVADVRTVKELLQLHAQTDRPVIRVGNTCYLLDGTTSYRLTLKDGGLNEPRIDMNHDDTLWNVSTRVEEYELILQNPFVTHVQITSAKDMLHLQSSSGRPVIRTAKAYHLLDRGEICFTYPIRERDLGPTHAAQEAAPTEQGDE